MLFTWQIHLFWMKCPEEDCQVPASFWHPTDLCTELLYLNFEASLLSSDITAYQAHILQVTLWTLWLLA